VEYDIDSEAKILAQCGLPHADWVARVAGKRVVSDAMSAF
jgi:hypothetical protein